MRRTWQCRQLLVDVAHSHFWAFGGELEKGVLEKFIKLQHVYGLKPHPVLHRWKQEMVPRKRFPILQTFADSHTMRQEDAPNTLELFYRSAC